MPECDECGRPYQDWAAGDDEWKTVVGAWDAMSICIDCFIARARFKHVHLHFVRYCPDGET